MTSQPKSTREYHGQEMASRIGTLPSGFSFLLNGTELVSNVFKRLETDAERRAFFDEFLSRQRKYFPTAWVAIYETVDLIRQNSWYWRDAGYKTFEDFWKDQGDALFGRWAYLEATYSYAKLAAPTLFQVNYEDAKALAQQLAPYRSILLADNNGKEKTEDDSKHRSQIPVTDSPVDPSDYVQELHSSDFQRGYAKGRSGSGAFNRFARLRRDAPEIAEQFLAGEFVRHYKNGKVKPDLKAAEIAAGIRKQDEPNRKRNRLSHCKQLISSMNGKQLESLQDHITVLLSRKGNQQE